MSVRIAIPVEDANGLNARLSQHFGRAPYFAVAELDENGKVLNLQMVPKQKRTLRRHRKTIRNPHELKIKRCDNLWNGLQSTKHVPKRKHSHFANKQTLC